MYTQFNISPVTKIKKKNISQKENVVEEITQLYLAPFTPKPKIVFEDILLGQKATRKLLIKNPNPKDTEIRVVQLPSSELNVCVSWEHNVISADSEMLLEIFWCPNTLGSWRAVLILEDSRYVKREIPIALKSIGPKSKKPSKRVKNKSPTFIAKKLKFTSPKHQIKSKSRLSPKIIKKQISHRPILPNITNLQQVFIQNSASSNEEWCSSLEFNRSDTFLSPSSTNFNTEIAMNDMRRETYTLKPYSSNSENIPLTKLNDLSEDSLEMSPSSPSAQCRDLIQGTILSKLQSNSFAFSPITPISEFNPTTCSSEGKSRDNLFVFKVNDAVKPLFVNTNMTYDLNTRAACPSPLNIQNISTETYIKGNVSSETYSKHSIDKRNSSSETYIKGSLEHVANENIFKTPIRQQEIISNTKTMLMLSNETDPFMSSTVNFDASCLQKYESYFSKWLNALLNPPTELNVQEYSQPIDVVQLWQKCKHKEVTISYIKESVSNKHNINARLNSLRKVARNFFTSVKTHEAVIKPSVAIDTAKILIRPDKNVHVDVSLQSEITSLLLCYNPLWLRIGLETIYDTEITMSSNSDILGLSKFIFQRFFKDQCLLKKYKSVYSDNYIVEIKKLIFKKFLLLVYFLDQAKQNKIISHDPCLFLKQAPIKESREILLNFSKELVSAGVGDITKFLRRKGYIVSFKQTYIDEFDYTVKCIGADLRDGVRLIKVMEIILFQEGLSNRLRVPAISRLQKIYNMTLVFDALKNAGFEIYHGIEPKDIVDGHREKTLSFLWQIVHKFQLPRIEKATITIQKWWKSLVVVLKRKILLKRILCQITAACKIQRWYRKTKRICKLNYFAVHLTKYLLWLKYYKASIKIQSFMKMILFRKKYLQIRKAAILIQTHSRKWLLKNNFQKRQNAAIKIQSVLRCLVYRKQYLKLKMTVLRIEEHYIANKQALIEREKYCKLRQAVMYIQNKFRANCLRNVQKQKFHTLKSATIFIQRWYRREKEMKQMKNEFLLLKIATIFVQQTFRNNRLMKFQRNNYKQLKKSVLYLQQKYRATKLMQKTRYNFLLLKHSTVMIQRYFRYRKKMLIIRNGFVELKIVTVYVQRRFRSNKIMKQTRNSFLQLKEATIKIQRLYRSRKAMQIQRSYYKTLLKDVLLIQRRFRANRKMKRERKRFLVKKQACLLIQLKFRNYLAMKKEKVYYQKLRQTTILLQKKFRSKQIMKVEQKRFLKIRNATVLIQTWYRVTKIMIIKKSKYYDLRKATLIIQQKFRATQRMRIVRAKYLIQRQACITLQRFYKAYKLMQKEKKYYSKLKLFTIFVQKAFRSKLATRIERRKFAKLKKAVIVVQNQFRANKSMQIQRKTFQNLRNAVIVIQQHYRATIQMRIDNNYFYNFKSNVIKLQRKYRATVLMKSERKKYVQLKRATLIIQTRYQAHLAMIKAKYSYEKFKNCIIFIQRLFRANQLMKIEKKSYSKMRQIVIIVQTRFRANQAMKVLRHSYLMLVKATILVQCRYRALKAMKMQRFYYENLKRFSILIQRKFRANIRMKIEKTYYITLRKCVLNVQELYRARLNMKIVRNEYLKLKQSVLTIQVYYRAYKIMHNQKQLYQSLKNATIFIQRKYRALKAMQKERKIYRNLLFQTLVLQRKFRANFTMKIEQAKFKAQKQSILKIQRFFRAHKLMLVDKQRYEKLKQYVIFIQRLFRANKQMKIERYNYLRIKNAACCIKEYLRSYIAMKRQRKLYVIELQAVITIQKYARGYLIRRQYNKEEIQRFKMLKKHIKATTKIQAVWRGYKLRKDHPEYSKIRKCVMFANSKATFENTLGYRRDNAMKIMISENNSLKMMIFALENLDSIIRRCRNTCVQMSEILPAQLYCIIINLNRSPGEVTSATLAASILVNFYKYTKTREKSWITQYIDDLLTTMLHFCDQEGTLFPYLCTLIWLFAHNGIYKKFIMKLFNLKFKLNKMRTLCERKENMWKASRNKLMPSVFAPVQNPPLPSLTPDWGFEYKHRPRMFGNSLNAINSLIHILDLH